MTSEYALNVDRTFLEPLAQAAFDCPDLKIDTWQESRLSLQGRRSIFRFNGTGNTASGPRPWSLILKHIQSPIDANAHDTAIDDWAYWPREPLLYAAGIPQTLQGDLRAPRCYGVMQPQPDVQWIWLEDVQDTYNRNWPIERYALAARHLGAFNVTYLAGKPLPQDSSLVSTGLRTRSASFVGDYANMRDPALWADPRMQRAFPQPVIERIDRLVAERDMLLQIVESMPQTFCHFDAWHGNMAAVNDAAGNDTTALFDWALACYGAAGQEIANCIWSTLLEFKLDLIDLPRLEQSVFDRYLEGLRSAGWEPDADEIRLAYLISSVLIFGLRPEAPDYVFKEELQPELERAYGWPIERMIAQSAEVTYLLLDRADEIRALLQVR